MSATHPTPELTARTLAAMDNLHARDAGCPRLEHWAAELHQLAADPSHYDHDLIVKQAAFNELNRVLGEVIVWLNKRCKTYFYCHDVRWRVRVWDDTNRLVLDNNYTNELTAKCELVCAAADVLVGDDDE
jgi:hypothetical protein